MFEFLQLERRRRECSTQLCISSCREQFIVRVSRARFICSTIDLACVTVWATYGAFVTADLWMCRCLGFCVANRNILHPILSNFVLFAVKNPNTSQFPSANTPTQRAGVTRSELNAAASKADAQLEPRRLSTHADRTPIKRGTTSHASFCRNRYRRRHRSAAARDALQSLAAGAAAASIDSAAPCERSPVIASAKLKHDKTDGLSYCVSARTHLRERFGAVSPP